MCEFPPYELISTLPEKLRAVFSRKAISHSDEYYQAFVENLLRKIVKRHVPHQEPPAPAPTTYNPEAAQAPWQGMGGGGPAHSQLRAVQGNPDPAAPNSSQQRPPFTGGGVPPTTPGVALQVQQAGGGCPGGPGGLGFVDLATSGTSLHVPSASLHAPSYWDPQAQAPYPQGRHQALNLDQSMAELAAVRRELTAGAHDLEHRLTRELHLVQVGEPGACMCCWP